MEKKLPPYPVLAPSYSVFLDKLEGKLILICKSPLTNDYKLIPLQLGFQALKQVEGLPIIDKDAYYDIIKSIAFFDEKGENRSFSASKQFKQELTPFSTILLNSKDYIVSTLNNKYNIYFKKIGFTVVKYTLQQLHDEYSEVYLAIKELD